MNSVIAIVGEEGDDLSGADALAKEAEQESASASSDKGGDKKESKKEEKPAKESKPKSESKPASEEKKPKESGKESGKELDLGDEAHVFASPLARRLAQNRGVPLAKVKGTGPNGRIVREDVEKYSGGASAGGAPSAPAAAPSAEATYTDTPLSNMRRTIAARLTESTQNVPHYFVSVDVEMDKVLQLREVFNRASAEAAKGDTEKAKAAKLSVNDFIMKAAALALKQVPSVNSAWHGDFIREYHVQDISMAVSTPTGLITPIVRNVVPLAWLRSRRRASAWPRRRGTAS